MAVGGEASQFSWMTKWGMTPAEALQTAFMVAANSLNYKWGSQIGSVEKGRYADIIAVSGNPLTDVTEMERVKFVMKGGEVFRNESARARREAQRLGADRSGFFSLPFGGIMTRWKSGLGVALAALVLPTVLNGQQGPLRHPNSQEYVERLGPTPRPSAAVAVRAGRLFDSKSGQMLTKQVVVILGERITEVGPEGRVTIPAGARVIDLSRATVMPGFIDGHSHVFESAPEKGQTQLDVGLHRGGERGGLPARGLYHHARRGKPWERQRRRRRPGRHRPG